MNFNVYHAIVRLLQLNHSVDFKRSTLLVEKKLGIAQELNSNFWEGFIFLPSLI